MALHVFVAMPYGVKEKINFNKVYNNFIKPALEDAGYEVFRADRSLRAGNIRADMFQELLLADLVVVDISIDNPNVWYELGVRHGLRARGIIQINCKRNYMPFDVYSDRTLNYHVKRGAPDPDFLEADKEALVEMTKETLNSWYGFKISPVYQLLPYLKEPDWKSLKVDRVREFWDKYEDWERRIEVARKRQKPGDIMVLANEASTWILRLEAHRTAGKALQELGQFSFALRQVEKALSINPKDLKGRQQKGILLARLKKYDAAKEWLKAIIKEHPESAESWALLGRLEKDLWVSTWHKKGKSSVDMKKDAAREESLLAGAIKPYLEGFLKDASHYYSGINAVTLMHLQSHLTGAKEKEDTRNVLEGGVRWAVKSALEKETLDCKDYWARVTLGDLEVFLSKGPKVKKTYEHAVAASEKNWFNLDSSRQQLLLLRDLGFRLPQVNSAIKVFDRALSNLKEPEGREDPRLVFLFSGHMVDAPRRAEPRFPNKEGIINIAADAIAKKLKRLGAGPEDLALCGGACGGDLLFAELCLERGLHLEVRIPFGEPKFLKNSVTFAGEKWRDRFYQVKEHPNTRLFVMPEELGLPPKNVNSYARNNLWQLYSALAWGTEKVRFICLWNLEGGDGPGGTQHMHDSVLDHAGKVYVLDTNKLW